MKIIDNLIAFNPYNINTPEELYIYWNDYINELPKLKYLLNKDNNTSTSSDKAIMDMVFIPAFEKLKDLPLAYSNCLEVLKGIDSKLSKLSEVKYQVILYWGNGAGAGWYSMYDKTPSILLGFENILILNWYSKPYIKALIAHEYGHLLHTYIRQEEVEEENSNTHAYDILYTEGFAQYIESIVTNTDSFQRPENENKDINNYIDNNLVNICKEYKNRIKAGLSVKDFFGSWYTWNGYKMLGYYLGFLVIKDLSKSLNLNEIASLSKSDYCKYIDIYLNNHL